MDEQENDESVPSSKATVPEQSASAAIPSATTSPGIKRLTAEDHERLKRTGDIIFGLKPPPGYWADQSRTKRISDNIANQPWFLEKPMRSAVIELNHDGMSFLEKVVLHCRVKAFYSDRPFTDEITETLRRAGLSRIADDIDKNRTESGGAIFTRPGVGDAILRELDWHHWNDLHPDLHAAGIAEVMRQHPELLLEAGRAMAAAYSAPDPGEWEEQADELRQHSALQTDPADPATYADIRQRIVALMKDRSKRHIWIEPDPPAKPRTPKV